MTKVLDIEPILRAYWDPKKFCENVKPDEQRTFEAVCDQESSHGAFEMVPYLSGSKKQMKLHEALSSPTFWANAKIIGQIGFLAELIGRWCEGCPCHWHLTSQKKNSLGNCRWKAARAPELAAGDAINLFKRSMEVSRHHIATCISLVPESQQHSLRTDFELSRATLSVELICKLGYWSKLPHCLCGLAHYDPTKATKSAIRCLEQWELGGVPCAHVMTRRFLDPGWKGLPGCEEEPLRPFVSWLSSF